MIKQGWSREGIKNRETKWDIELGRIQGVPFWDRCYKIIDSIFFDNRIKWLQYQIVRGTLKTNKIISKFKRNIQPSCTFCNIEIETIEHLFWSCHIVQNFIKEVSEHSVQSNPSYFIEDNGKPYIFSNSKNKIDCTLVFQLLLKYFIWITRCGNKTLNLNNFLIGSTKK